MRALLRKDRGLLMAIAAMGAGIHLLTLAAISATPVWVYPSGEVATVVSATLALFASVLGLWTAVRDELFRTRDYLIHRPVSAGIRFAANHLGCAIVMAVWVVVPLVLFLALTYATKDWASMIEPGRFIVYVGIELGAALPAYAFGVLAGTVAPRLVASVILTAAIVVAGMAVGAALIPVPLAIAFALRVFFGGLALASIALAAAYLADRAPRDADRPWSRARLLVVAPLLVVVSTVAVTALALTGAEGGRQMLDEAYPFVFERPDRTLSLARNERLGGGGRTLELDALHRPVGEVVRKRGERLRTADHGSAFSEWRWSPDFPIHEAFGSSFRPVRCAGTCMLARDQMNLVELRFGPDGRSRRVGKPAGVPPFSNRTQIVGTWADSGTSATVLLGDPTDGTLWAYVSDQGDTFRPLALPGGDRFVVAMPVVARRGYSYDPAEDPAEVFVRGEKDFYAFGDAGFVPAPDSARPELEKSWSQRRWAELVLLDHDPLTFTMETRPVDGRPPFRHHFTPRSGWERAAAGLMYLSSLVRPPVLQGAALVLEPWSRPLSRPALDSLVAGGKRPWLLFVVFASGLVFTALTYRRLRRVGAPVRDRVVWTVAALLTGWIGWGLARLLAPDRAFRAIPTVATAVAPALLLQSA